MLDRSQRLERHPSTGDPEQTMGTREQRSNREQKKKAVMTPKEKKAAKKAKRDAKSATSTPGS
jgi:hypothetical protein